MVIKEREGEEQRDERSCRINRPMATLLSSLNLFSTLLFLLSLLFSSLLSQALHVALLAFCRHRGAQDGLL
jgi:hypothetical protein